MTVHHQVGAVNQGIFEAGPDLPPQLRGDVQFDTKVSEPHAGQVVHLSGEGEASLYTILSAASTHITVINRH